MVLIDFPLSTDCLILLEGVLNRSRRDRHRKNRQPKNKSICAGLNMTSCSEILKNVVAILVMLYDTFHGKR